MRREKRGREDEKKEKKRARLKKGRKKRKIVDFKSCAFKVVCLVGSAPHLVWQWWSVWSAVPA
jgi:hypothetical protein